MKLIDSDKLLTYLQLEFGLTSMAYNIVKANIEAGEFEPDKYFITEHGDRIPVNKIVSGEVKKKDKYLPTDYSDYIKFRTDNGYIAKDGAPLKCQFCESTHITDAPYARIDNTVTEVEAYCGDCHMKIGHWAYGHWGV